MNTTTGNFDIYANGDFVYAVNNSDDTYYTIGKTGRFATAKEYNQILWNMMMLSNNHYDGLKQPVNMKGKLGLCLGDMDIVKLIPADRLMSINEKINDTKNIVNNATKGKCA